MAFGLVYYPLYHFGDINNMIKKTIPKRTVLMGSGDGIRSQNYELL
jgi:hypothetical protein